MQGKGPWMHLGIDESNNGGYPVYFVAVFSDDKKDTVIRGEDAEHMPKINSPSDSFWGRFSSNRRYTFTLYEKSDDYSIGNDWRLGVVTGSLIYEERIGERLDVLIDGTHYSRDQIKDTRAIVSEVSGLERDLINIIYKKKLDKRNTLTHTADGIARWLNKGKTLEEIKGKPQKKKVLTDLIPLGT